MRHNMRLNANYGNENIDPERSRLNYFLGACSDPVGEVRSKLDALPRKPRKDAVVLFCWVVTAPKDLRPCDSGRFFDSVYRFLCNRYGEGNMISAAIHRDETNDHGHFASMPITEDGRLCAKEVLNRSELKRFHGDLSAWVERDLGYRVSVELDDSQRAEKALSKVPQDEYIAAKNAISEASERLERLQREEAETVEEVARIERRVRIVGERVESLRERLRRVLSPSQYLARFGGASGRSNRQRGEGRGTDLER